MNVWGILRCIFDGLFLFGICFIIYAAGYRSCEKKAIKLLDEFEQKQAEAFASLTKRMDKLGSELSEWDENTED